MGSVQIKGGQIVDSAIIAAKLASNAVTSAKISDGAITSGKLGSSAVLTAALNDGAVTAAKLGSASVESAKLADGAVLTAKLADGAVEAVFEGDPPSVDRIVAWVGHGPPEAVVTGVDMNEEAPREERGFRILP